MGDIAVATKPVEIRYQITAGDKLGNQVRTWDNWAPDDDNVIPGHAYIEKQVSTKGTKSEKRRQKVTTWLVIFDYAPPITGDERIYDPATGLLLEMTGRPIFAQNPDGYVNHTEVECVEAVG